MPPSRANSERMQLYQLAFQPVHLYTGTPYQCRQEDLNSCLSLRSPGPNLRQLVSAERAAREILEQNSEERQESDIRAEERNAMRRLSRGVEQCAEEGFGPDVIIKMFADLDLVFFRGVILGNVTVKWARPRELPYGVFAATTLPTHGNQCSMLLNPESILLGSPSVWSPFRQMMGTVLHEMVHAYRHVRCPPTEWGVGDGHDLPFRTIIHAVHRRAYDNLGAEVISANEDYFHHHRMSDQWAHEEGGGLYGPHENGPIRGPEHFRGDGVERNPISSGYGVIGGSYSGAGYGGESYDDDDEGGFSSILDMLGLGGGLSSMGGGPRFEGSGGPSFAGNHGYGGSSPRALGVRRGPSSDGRRGYGGGRGG